MNTHNRTVRRNHIEGLRKHLEKGSFLLTNQGVGVTQSSVLADGQHRLMAIAEAGYPPVEILVVTGLQDIAQSIIDVGPRRSMSDILRLALNQTVSATAVAAINVMTAIRETEDGFTFNKSNALTEFEMADFFESHASIIEAHFKSAGVRLRAGVNGALLHYAMKYDVDAACELGQQIKTGVNLAENSPAYRLRNWIEKNKSLGPTGQFISYQAAVTACCNHAKKETISVLKQSTRWNLPKKK